MAQARYIVRLDCRAGRGKPWNAAAQAGGNVKYNSPTVLVLAMQMRLDDLVSEQKTYELRRQKIKALPNLPSSWYTEKPVPPLTDTLIDQCANLMATCQTKQDLKAYISIGFE